MPAGLVKSTIKLAALWVLGSSASPISLAPRVAELANGMGKTILLAKAKASLGFLVVAAGLLAAIGFGLTYIPAAQNSDPSKPNPAATERPVTQTAPRAESSKFQMTGTVRDESTGAPVAGVTVEVVTGYRSKEYGANFATAKSGKNGTYALGLSAGHYQPSFPVPPAGYWFPLKKARELFALTKAEPVARQDYLVRRGNALELSDLP